jgi:hypothetical protein
VVWRGQAGWRRASHTWGNRRDGVDDGRLSIATSFPILDWALAGLTICTRVSGPPYIAVLPVMVTRRRSATCHANGAPVCSLEPFDNAVLHAPPRARECCRYSTTTVGPADVWWPRQIASDCVLLLRHRQTSAGRRPAGVGWTSIFTPRAHSKATPAAR